MTVEPTEVLPARAANAAAQTGTAAQPTSVAAPVAVSLPRVERHLHLHDNRTTTVVHHHHGDERGERGEAATGTVYRHEPATVASARTRRATAAAFVLAALGSAVLAAVLLLTGSAGFAAVPLAGVLLNGALALRVVTSRPPSVCAAKTEEGD